VSDSTADTQFLTPDDLASMWQLSVVTFANWRTNKKGPEFVRIGGLVRYSPAAVNDWLAKQPTK
jgi:predicted DNA-binding transcriptional regulator AlpA